MKAVLLATLVAVAGCAAAPPHRYYPAYGSGAASYRHAAPHRYGHASRHHVHHRVRHPVRRLPPGSFDEQTRRRCAAGDAGACRMLRAIGGSG